MYITKHLYVTLLKVFECIIGSSLRFSSTCVIIVTNSNYVATAQDRIRDQLYLAVASLAQFIRLHAFATQRRWITIISLLYSASKSRSCVRRLQTKKFYTVNDHAKFSIPTEVSNSMVKPNTNFKFLSHKLRIALPQPGNGHKQYTERQASYSWLLVMTDVSSSASRATALKCKLRIVGRAKVSS